MPESRLLRRMLRGAGIMALLGVLAIVVLVIALRVEHTMTTTLPAPTGPFAVGRALYDWVNPRPDALAPTPGTQRELLVWIWYPAAKGQSADTADYVPPPLRVEVERDRGALIGRYVTRDLSKVRAHSIGSAALSPERPSYPVVVMRAGASAEVWNYTTLAEDLASQGYVVVGFDAPWRTSVVVFPDGRTMRRIPANNPELAFGAPDSARRIDRLLDAWTGDTGFVLDRLEALNATDSSGIFTGRLDLAHVGVFGHSFGGAVAAQFCGEDSRCTAGVDIDGAPLGRVIREGIPRPFMFLLSGHGGSADPGDRQIEADIDAIYDRLPPDGRLRVEILGAYHFGFSDDGAVVKSHILLRALRFVGVIGLDGRRQLAATSYCLRRFFDTELQAAGGSRVDLSSSDYPEVVVHE